MWHRTIGKRNASYEESKRSKDSISSDFFNMFFGNLNDKEPSKVKAKKVFQVLDHCSIFLLISGTYTPFALCTLREYNTALGWVIFGLVQGMAVLGIVLNAIDLKKYKKFSMICYLIMGWCIIFLS